MNSNTFFPNRTASPFGRNSEPETTIGHFPSAIRVGGYLLSLASNIGALEECLALERTSITHNFSSETGGILSPPAVPYCDFLMLKNNANQLMAVCRLMRRRLGRDNAVRTSLEMGHFRLSPLITALRYSREGIVEMGAPAYCHTGDSTKLAELLWVGLIQYLERNGVGFVIGLDSLSNELTGAKALPQLMSKYGLHPDLEVDIRYRPQGNKANSQSEINFESFPLPPSLGEALRRGCRLAAEPIFNDATNRWEFIWVSSRDMLNLNSGANSLL